MKTGIVLCARNEEHIIEEWIAHHIALGFDHILIFDNMSTDDTAERVRAMARQFRSVALLHWPSDSNAQVLAYDEGLRRMGDANVDWCLFVDADEFLAPPGTETLHEFLEQHQDHVAIGLNWSIYGSAERQTRLDGLIQEQFLYRAPAYFGPNHHIKSFVRPAKTFGAYGSHGFKIEGGLYHTAGGDKIEWKLPYAYTENTPDLKGWHLNHYFCQWRGRWEAKVARSGQFRRGNPRTEADWIHHDRNDIFDPSALRWTPADRAIMNLARKCK